MTRRAAGDKSRRLDDVRLLKLAEMYENAFERFVLDVSQRYVEDEEVRAKLAALVGPTDAHAERIAAQLDRLNREIGPADRAGVERAALLDILDVERAAHDFYLRSLDKVHDSVVADLFRQLAREEGEHIRIAQDALALADRHRGRTPGREGEGQPTRIPNNETPLWEGVSDLSKLIHLGGAAVRTTAGLSKRHEGPPSSASAPGAPRGPAEILREEHDVIRQLLHALSGIAAELEAGRQVPKRDVDEALDAVVGFADQCHHAKEETVLFPALARTSPEGAPRLVHELEGDHKAGRKLVGTMQREASKAVSGDADAAGRFARAARLYVKVLEAHIEHETTRLLPLVDSSFPLAEKERLAVEFDRVEREGTGEAGHRRYEGIVHRLGAKYAGRR